MDLDREKLSIIASAMEEAGQLAFEKQKQIHRSFKQDGSVITEADIAISRRITALIRKLFPQAGILSEEELLPPREDAEWTFVLDPIDGTDVYSQGLPTFAVSLGILDSEHRPVGAYIAAPRFGVASHSLFIRMDPGTEPLANGQRIGLSGDKDTVTEITMGSKAYRYLDFSRFSAKTRILGSTILHLLTLVLFPAMEGSIVFPCYAWDIASSHAVLRHFGMDLCYGDGTLFSYTDEMVFGRQPFRSALYAGTDKVREELIRTLPERRS